MRKTISGYLELNKMAKLALDAVFIRDLVRFSQENGFNVSDYVIKE